MQKRTSPWGHAGRLGAVFALGLAAAEVLIMISPFAGFFYSAVGFEGVLARLSESRFTAWLTGFFLNHAVVTRSALLEGQREAGRWLFGLGLWGFGISAVQVYGSKLLRRGVADGLLYRFVRHPQYLCLAVAGWGLLTIWPRFLLLGIWVAMLFLYAGLARFEERRMEERFGYTYIRFARTRGAFLPGSPVRRAFEATFGRLRPRPVGWAAAFAACLAGVFALGFAARSYTLEHASVAFAPEHRAAVVSAWPEPESWARRVFETAVREPAVQERLRAGRDGRPLVATILPPEYVMKGMYYTTPERLALRTDRTAREQLLWVGRIALHFLVPVLRADHFMGVDPGESGRPVQVVFSRADKPYADRLDLEDALDPGVRATPLAVVEVDSEAGEVVRVLDPLPRNAFGPKVVMPLL